MSATGAGARRARVARPRRPGRAAAFLLGAILTEVVASLSLKAALSDPVFVVVVVAGYLTSFVLLALVLRAGISIGVAYGVWGACGVSLTAVMSMLLYDEPVTPVMWAGIVLVVAGVLCVEFGAHMPAQRRGTR